MDDIFSVSGRVALVTGASSGLGERFARVLHAHGATVIAGARRVDRLDALAADLGDGLIPVSLDIAVEDDCKRFVDATEHDIDILVNNAAIGQIYPAEEEPLEHWRTVVDINLTGLFILSQLVGQRMLRRGRGSIINISSIFGSVASAPIAQASYCATKGAVTNLTRELGCQWAGRGVRVNAIAPGWFPTEMTNDGMFQDEQAMMFLRRNTPMRRAGVEGELDGALLYLASDASSFVTGITLHVDGGWTAR